MRLITRNVIGIRPGVLDHASQAHRGKFSYCLAENEEERELAYRIGTPGRHASEYLRVQMDPDRWESSLVIGLGSI